MPNSSPPRARPRDLVSEAEASPAPAPRSVSWLRVIRLPLRSGHLLAMRRFASSSLARPTARCGIASPLTVAETRFHDFAWDATPPLGLSCTALGAGTAGSTWLSKGTNLGGRDAGSCAPGFVVSERFGTRISAPACT